MKMEQHISLDNINPLKVKDLLRKVCIISHGYSEKGRYIANTPTEKALRAKIQQLEEELQQTMEEKNKALNENRDKINELNMALLSVKTSIRELIHYKKERDKRLRDLERKIIKTAKS